MLHNFVNIAQWLIDAGDPINVAPFVIDPNRRLPGVPPKRILMHEGVRDNVVPNSTTDNLALAMGLPDAKATRGCSNAAGCSGIWRFVMTEYGQDDGRPPRDLRGAAGRRTGEAVSRCRTGRRLSTPHREALLAARTARTQQGHRRKDR